MVLTVGAFWRMLDGEPRWRATDLWVDGTGSWTELVDGDDGEMIIRASPQGKPYREVGDYLDFIARHFATVGEAYRQAEVWVEVNGKRYEPHVGTELGTNLAINVDTGS